MRAERGVHRAGAFKVKQRSCVNHGWKELGRQRRIVMEGISEEGNGVFTQRLGRMWCSVKTVSSSVGLEHRGWEEVDKNQIWEGFRIECHA